VKQLVAIVLTPVLAIAGGTWWLARNMATKDELRLITTDVASLKSELSLVRVDVAGLKDRGERREPTAKNL
jgi:hypothetical protein